MTRKDWTIGLGLVTLALAAQEAVGETSQYCGPRDAVVHRLADGYGETRRAVGLGSNNAMVEIFASDDSGSWTITVTDPQGTTCLVASGQAFRTIATPRPLIEKGA
jgi:hypothetical protein